MPKRTLTSAAPPASLIRGSGGCDVIEFESLAKRAWTGAARVRANGAFGTIWFVKGHCVHAMLQRGEQMISGWNALDQIVHWTEGTTFLENDALPPERSIRLGSQDVWEVLKSGELKAAPENLLARDSDTIESSFKPDAWQRLRTLAGIVYLSTTHGESEDHVGALNAHGRSWVRRCLRAFSDTREAKRLVVENARRILLVCKNGERKTVVVAQAGTDVQDLMNAVTEFTADVPVQAESNARRRSL